MINKLKSGEVKSSTIWALCNIVYREQVLVINELVLQMFHSIKNN